MFDFVRGDKIYLDPLVVCVANSFWGIRAFTTRDSYENYLSKDEITVFIYSHIVNESTILYGFATEIERTFFQLLIRVSGIGPKLAIRALAHLSYKEIYRGILDNDPKLLASLPGIGGKTAQKMILELQDKVRNIPIEITSQAGSHIFSEAFMALENFGFDSSKIQSAIRELQKKQQKWELPLLIRELLIILNKK